MMKFIEEPNTRAALIRRYDVANTLSAVAPANVPTTDYQRGYVDALIRVARVFGVVLAEPPSMVVEVYDEQVA